MKQSVVSIHFLRADAKLPIYNLTHWVIPTQHSVLLRLDRQVKTRLVLSLAVQG